MNKNNRHNATTDNDATYDHIVKYIGLFGGVQGLNLLIGIVRNKITAYLLGPSGIGLINIYNKVVGLIGQATNLGLSFSAVKYVAELSESTDHVQRDKLIDTVRMWCLLTAALGFLTGLFLAPWISLWTFGNYGYTPTFCIISLIVAMSAIMGGEIAILKGLKRLKKVAIISIFAAVATLLICIPFYYYWGVNGVVGALVASNAVVLAIHIHFSSKVAPWRRSIATINSIKAGSPMVKLGIAYIVAGIFGQGADYIILAFIQNNGGLDYVGLYNTGFFLAVSMGAILFSAVEADFFPRLSSLVNDVKRANMTINRQIKACVHLATPFLIIEVLAMPFMVQLLYTKEFSQASSMAICAIFYLFFRAFILPIAYLPLAKGDSKTYLLAEVIYDVFIAIAIPTAFATYGLVGAGCALSLAGLFDLLFISIYYRTKYKFKFTKPPVWSYLLQFALLGVSVYASLQLSNPWGRWGISAVALSASLYIAYKELNSEMALLETITRKIKKTDS